MAKVFIPRERLLGETRVAATPETVRRFAQAKLEVVVEAGAGAAAHLSDEAFQRAGAAVTRDVRAAWAASDVVLKVRHPTDNPDLGGAEADALREGAVLVGFLAPHRQLSTVRTLAARRVTALAMELVPRITRAQKMDALSSQASIAGYRAALWAATRLPKYFPLMMTAAGTVSPARVLVIGAGVAGLQAVATARRLGAIVEVSDIRAEAKEQVQSLGARFVDVPGTQSGQDAGGYAREVTAELLERQRAVTAEHVAASDVVIATAAVPGKPAPQLISAEMVRRMRPGSVIVDVAAEAGGNCELTKVGEEVAVDGVTIVGHANLPATMPADASALYARNVLELVLLLVDKEGRVALRIEDEVIAGTLLTHAGEVRHAPTAARLAKAAG